MPDLVLGPTELRSPFSHALVVPPLAECFGHFSQMGILHISADPSLIRDLDDEQMLGFMGRENLEDYNADFLCMLESWEAGRVFFWEPDPSGVKDAEIARVLGWTRVDDTATFARGSAQCLEGIVIASLLGCFVWLPRCFRAWENRRMREYRASSGRIESVIKPGESLAPDELEARHAKRDAKQREAREIEDLQLLVGTVRQAVAVIEERQRREALAQLYAEVHRTIGASPKAPEPDALERHVLGDERGLPAWMN